MTEAKASFGTKLRKDGVYVAELTNIGGPNKTAKTVEVTNHDSPDRYEEFLQTIKTGGDVTISGNFIPGNAGQAALDADFESGALVTYELVYPDAASTVITLPVIVTAFGTVDKPVDGNLGFSATLKVSGKPAIDYTYSDGLTTTFFALSVGDDTVLPVKAGNVYFYTANVINATTSLTVTPIATAGVIKVNGNVVATGVPSSAIPLAVGPNTINVEVKEINKVARAYVIVVTRVAL